MWQREAELAALWAAGTWRGRTLRSAGGAEYTVLYEGRRGGSAGPDFRDAVLARGDGRRVCGDVELHVRASGWRTHGHTSDPRYNSVVLHAVLRVAAGECETLLANGASAPVVVLQADATKRAGARACNPPAWPCTQLADPERQVALRALVETAGQARFDTRVDAFAAELHAASASILAADSSAWSPADRVLWVALAEGLGYGRDRAALRELGLRLALGMPPEEVCWRSERLGRVERSRAAGLVTLWRRWQECGPWEALRRALAAEDARARERSLRAALRVSEARGAISRGRALIVAANVALPFAAARAQLEGDVTLERHARELYAALSGLPSNSITRTMRDQLGMARLPSRARAHQGLHHIWATHCREKHCAGCPCAADTQGALHVQ